MSGIKPSMLRSYPDLMNPEEARRALNIGRSKMYTLLKSGTLRSFKVGANYRIPKAFLIEYLNGTT